MLTQTSIFFPQTVLNKQVFKGDITVDFDSQDLFKTGYPGFSSSCQFKGELKSSYDYVISAADSFDQWDPSTAAPMEEVYRAQGGLC